MKGIYLITNHVNGKIYVGSSRDIYARLRQHFNALIADRHGNIHLQRAWKEYGEDAFSFSIVESVEDETRLIEAEQVWIDKSEAAHRDVGYNISPSARGRAMPEEVKAKLRAKRLGGKLTDEHRRKLSESHLGQISWNKGKRFSEESKKKMSDSMRKKYAAGFSPWNKGRPMDEATKLKISIGRTGKGLGCKHGFTKGQGFWLGKKRPNVSGENHYRWRARVARLAQQPQESIT